MDTKREIIIIKSTSFNDVRINKYIKVYKEQGISIHYIGWDRLNSNEHISGEKTTYLLKGFSSNKILIILGTLIWIVKLYLYLILHIRNYDKIHVVNFDSGYPVFLSNKIRTAAYCYDIFDELAISYNFPSIIKNTIKRMDRKIKNKSDIIIHVDKSRVDDMDKKYCIIPNIPFDFYNGDFCKIKFEPKIAITGYLQKNRGLDSIYSFAQNNPVINFYLYGRFPDLKEEKKFSELKNVHIHDFINQNSLFDKIKDFSFIMALYNPEIEINRKAASNKLYDSLMLGIPIITNEGLIMSQEVKEKELGIIVDYEYNESWTKISETINNINKLLHFSSNCREEFDHQGDFRNYVLNNIIKPTLLNQ